MGAFSAVPPEVWERVLDLSQDHHAEEDEKLGKTSRGRYSTLISCALVCQAWLPRTRVLLYRTVHAFTPTRLNLLIRTITAQPWLGSLVRELVIGREGGTDLKDSSDAYFPFAHGILISHLCNLVSLELRSLDFWRKYPPRYHTFLTRYPVQELTLAGCSLPIAHLFQLVWSLPALHTLVLHDSDGDVHGHSEADLLMLDRMHRGTDRGRCPNLRKLTISASYITYNHFPPRGAFGTAIESLTLTDVAFVPTRLRISGAGRPRFSDTFLSFLSGLVRLSGLRIVFSRGGYTDRMDRAPNAYVDVETSGPTQSVTGTDEDRAFLSNLVRSIHARDTFHTLSVTLPYHPRRLNSALDDILFNASLEDALSAFPNFTHLFVHPPSDNRSSTSGHQHQWHPHLAMNMPKLRPMLAPADIVFPNCTEASAAPVPGVPKEQAFRIWCDGHLLVFPTGEHEALDLQNENRLLVCRGKLAIPTPWVEVYAFLFDNYLVITELIEVEGNGEYNVSRPPISLDLLRVTSFHDPPFLRHEVHRRLMPHSQSLYPFTVYHDSRVGGFLTLCTDSAHERHIWKEKFSIAFNLNRIDNEWSKPFTMDIMSPAWKDTEPSGGTEDDSEVLTGKITCSIPLTTADGRVLVAVGGDQGLWIGWRHDMRSMFKLLASKSITQCAVLEDCRIFLVLADGILYAYRIDSSITATTDVLQILHPFPQVFKRKAAIKFFIVGKQRGRTLVIYMRRTGDDSIFSILEPTSRMVEGEPEFTAGSSTRESPPSILGRLRPPRPEYLKAGQEFLLPAEAYDVIFLKTRSALLCPLGFEIMDLQDFTFRSVTIPQPIDESIKLQSVDGPEELKYHLPQLAERLKKGRPLGMFRCPNSDSKEFLLCYDEFGFYVNQHGDINRFGVTIAWEGVAAHVVWRDPYILLFSKRYIEVRHVATGNLVQVIPGRDIRWTGDERRITDAPVTTEPLRDAEGPPHRSLYIHGVMEASDTAPSGSQTPPSEQRVFELVPVTPLYVPRFPVSRESTEAPQHAGTGGS